MPGSIHPCARAPAGARPSQERDDLGHFFVRRPLPFGDQGIDAREIGDDPVPDPEARLLAGVAFDEAPDDGREEGG